MPNNVADPQKVVPPIETELTVKNWSNGGAQRLF